MTDTTDAAARAPLAGRTLIKGHGAQNDFLLDRAGAGDRGIAHAAAFLSCLS